MTITTHANSAESAHPTPTQIEGRLEGVDGIKVYGWAWDRAQPHERLRVEIWLGRTRLAAVTADRPRPDLKENGIGDGAHAFETDLASPPTPEQHRDLRVLALLPGSDAVATLARRSELEIAAEAAVIPGMRRLHDAIEVMAARQRDLVIGQQAIANWLRSNAPAGSPPAPAATPALEKINTVIAQLVDRTEVLETFLMRFDERLKELEEVRSAQTRPACRPGSALALWPALSLLATGLVLGVGAAMLLVDTGVGAIP